MNTRIKEGVAILNQEGEDFTVTLIQVGKSANNNYYSEDVLREAVPLLENCLCYNDHGEIKRSPSELVGIYKDVVFENNAIRAKLNTLKPWEWLKDTYRNGINDRILGLSLDFFGLVEKGSINGENVNIVRKITGGPDPLNKPRCDLVLFPAAGGRLSESAPKSFRESIQNLLGRLVCTRERLHHQNEAIANQIDELMSDIEFEVQRSNRLMQRQIERLKDVIQENSRVASQVMIEEKLRQCSLSETGRDLIREHFRDSASEEEIEEAIRTQEDYERSIIKGKRGKMDEVNGVQGLGLSDGISPELLVRLANLTAESILRR